MAGGEQLNAVVFPDVKIGLGLLGEMGLIPIDRTHSTKLAIAKCRRRADFLWQETNSLTVDAIWITLNAVPLTLMQESCCLLYRLLSNIARSRKPWSWEARNGQ